MTTHREQDAINGDFVRIAHVLPQRIRLRAPYLVAQPEVCRRIAERLLQMPDLADKITVNSITGSIVVEDSRGPVDPAKLLLHLQRYVEEEIQTLPKPNAEPTKIAQSVARAFAELNRDVRGGLHHRADLAILLPICLATLALGQIFTAGRLPAPAWFNFCWWAFRAFLTFHKDAKGHEYAQSPEGPKTSRTSAGETSENSTSPEMRHSSSAE
ncbi:MAG TPA: hypothetical protein PK156_15690 [Polyangium sp.]|nr:hypothetical protein [Polyangium sp.]